MDQAMSLGERPATPEPGDVTLCIRCGAVLLFDAVGVELPDEDRLRELMADRRVANAQVLVQRMNAVRRAMEGVR